MFERLETKTPVWIACITSLLMLTGGLHAAVDTTLFNATTNTGGDDPAGQGTGFAATSSISGDTVEDAFGNNDGGVEPNTFLFADGRTPDNGDATLGNGGETVDAITWQTTGVVIIDGYRLTGGPDGDGSGNRGIQLAAFSVEGEQDDLFDRDAGGSDVDRTFAIAQVGNDFQFQVTHNTSAGARVDEIEALVTDTSSAAVNTTIFNATTNTGSDDPAGLSTGFSSSALIGPGETLEDAFGNTDGGVEGDTVLFQDGGTVDNGNNIFGDGGETVDFIEWSTTSKVQLDGYQVSLNGDGGVEDAGRSTELIRFYVEGALVDIFDANGHSGSFTRLFGAGALIGDDFRLELTRATSGGANGGPRLVEIDAVNAVAVPVPAALPAGLALMGLTILRRRRRA